MAGPESSPGPTLKLMASRQLAIAVEPPGCRSIRRSEVQSGQAGRESKRNELCQGRYTVLIEVGRI